MSSIVIIAALVGAAVGGVFAWILRGSRAAATTAASDATLRASQLEVSGLKQQLESVNGQLRAVELARAALDTKLSETEKHLVEQRTLLDEAKAKLTEAFKAAAADALASNNQGFLVLAQQRFDVLKQAAVGELDTRKQAVENLVAPIRETLDKYQSETKQLEERRLQELSTLEEQLRSLNQAQTQLQGETSKLVNALRTPHIRGAWGEMTLRRTAELAGMSSHCDFVEQESVTTETGRLRPDMVVRLPAGRTVVVDAKVPLAAYLEALEATNDAQREAALDRHVAHVYQHIEKLAEKQYWQQFDSAPEFVLLFIPNDSFLAAAAERDPSILEAALNKKVVIATPTTFIALLRAIAYGWKQEIVAESAQEVSKLGKELAERIATWAEHLGKVGQSLDRAIDAYNAAVGSLETRVLSTARKFEALGAGGTKEIPELESVDKAARALGAGER